MSGGLNKSEEEPSEKTFEVTGMPSNNCYGRGGCKDATWEKASAVRGKDPDEYRRDARGNVICYSSYGKYSPMGWQIDHIKPQSAGGSNHQRNLQALQSYTNLKKSNKW